MITIGPGTPSAAVPELRSGVHFEDAFTILFAVWALVGHLAIFSNLNVRECWLLAWVLSATTVFFFLRGSRARGTAAVTPDMRHAKSFTWIAILLGVVFTLCLHRPDADDSLYLAQQVRALDGPTAPFRSLAEAPAYNAGYITSTYEFLRAGFAWLTGVPLLVSYYLIWPAVVAAMAVAYLSRLLRLAGVQSLAIALLMWFVVMLAWGDAHRTPSNFGFVRMFQGKAALVWVTIPAAQYYWLRFVTSRERRALWLYYASLVAGIGFSPTGVPTGVLLVGIFIAATAIGNRVATGRGKTLVQIAFGGVYPLLIGLLMRFYFGHAPDAGILPDELLIPPPPAQIQSAPAAPVAAATVPAPTPTPPVVSRVDYTLAFGRGPRFFAAVACLAALPALLRASPIRTLLSFYAGICVLLLAFPRTSELLGRFAYSSFSWRWLFVIPFSFCLAIAAERLATRFHRPLVRWAVATLTAVAFLYAAPIWTVSRQNNAELRRPGFKLPSRLETSLLGYDRPAKIEGWWLISPATGARL